MRISKKTQYGLRAMVYLANPRLKNKVCPSKEISREEEIPAEFLEKIFSDLEKSKLVKAKKGAQGGYYLAQNPKKIKIAKIIEALERDTALVFCLVRKKGKNFLCPREKKCRTKKLWKKIQKSLSFTLNSITLADLIKSHGKF